MNPIKATKAFFIEPLKYYANILRSLGSLMIEDIDMDDSNLIYINDKYEGLYCVELAGAGEAVSFLPSTLIDSLAADFSDEETGEMTWVVPKDGLLKKNLIFTRNKNIAIQIQNAINSKILTFDELFDRILSLYFNNDYEIDWYKRELSQKYKIDFQDEYKNPLNVINSLIRERVFTNYEKVKFYQATSYKNDMGDDDVKFDIEQFFKINFKGALYTKIIFYKKKIIAELENQKLNTIGQFSNQNKNTIKALQASIESKNRVLINTTLQVYDDFGSTVSTKVETVANCTFDIITRDTKELNNKTPIVAHNKNFSRIIRKEFLHKYISYNSKLDSDRPHLVGTTTDGTYINFGFKNATATNFIPKQHTILLGTSGAGKTQAANDILKQLLGYDYENKKLHHIEETNHIIFDIKDSFYNQIKKLKEDFPDMVDMNDFNKNDFLYNIVDCDLEKKGEKYQVNESDLDFSATLVSLILSAGGNVEEALTTAQAEEYKEAIRVVNASGYESLTVVSLRDTHIEDYKKIRSLGYKEHTPIDEIKEKGFEKFKKPLLHNIINYLKNQKSRYELTKETLREELVNHLIYKLETILKMQIFSSYSKLNFKDKKIIYFKTDDALEDKTSYGYLIFAMQSILAKKAKATQHAKRIAGVKRPLVFFWYEEARNIFANKLFKEKEVFERIINEWRSYDMVFFPITQEPQHIPDSILNGFEITIMMTSGDDEEEKEFLIDNLSKRLAIGEKRKKILKTLPKYNMFIMYGDGAFTLKFKDDENFRKIVNT